MVGGAAGPSGLPIRVAHFPDLAPHELYAILRLRVEVFTVEQDCAYQDLDGKDTDPSTLLLWQEDDGRVVSTIRVLFDDDGGEAVIGRVVTDPACRGRGLSAELMREGIARARGLSIRISAQAHLQHWYERFGFVRFGDEYLEDGIPHVAMRRPA